MMMLSKSERETIREIKSLGIVFEIEKGKDAEKKAKKMLKWDPRLCARDDRENSEIEKVRECWMRRRGKEKKERKK